MFLSLLAAVILFAMHVLMVYVCCPPLACDVLQLKPVDLRCGCALPAGCIHAKGLWCSRGGDSVCTASSVGSAPDLALTCARTPRRKKFPASALIKR
ncbi:hypothetical protein C8Q79DRAFT_991166 [Trametes meyenii]|nr:hypothetical protein C8Q79DRAFT_991166 [Trametes meyenii]